MAFATATHIATRLARTLSEEEGDAAELLLDGVAAEICEATGRDEDAIEDVPILRFISIEAVCRVLANPGGAQDTRESIGSYSYAATYAESGDTLLTRSERQAARRAVFGSSLVSPQTPPPIDDYYFLAS